MVANDPMLNMREAAEQVGVKLRTWQRKYQVWEVPHFRVGKMVLFRASELASWLESRRAL